MEERVRVSEKDKKEVRDVMKEVFHTPIVPDDEDAMMADFKRHANDMINELKDIEINYIKYNYPGKKVIDDGKRLFQSAIQINDALEFFGHISKMRDFFYDFDEDYEPVKAFFKGGQKEIFSRAIDKLRIYDDSKTYIVDATLEDTVKKMRDILKMSMPYKEIHKLPELMEQYQDAYNKVLDEELHPICESVKECRTYISDTLNEKEYANEKRQKYLTGFDELLNEAESSTNVSTLRGLEDKAKALMTRLLGEMDMLDEQIAKKKQAEIEQSLKEKAGQMGIDVDDDQVKKSIEEQSKQYKVKKTKNIPIKKMTGTMLWRLESKEDIDRYLSSLRERMLKELEEDTVINIQL